MAVTLTNLVSNALFSSGTGWTSYTGVSGGEIYYSGANWNGFGSTVAIADTSGHKYYYAVSAKTSDSTRDTRYGLGLGSGGGSVFEAPYIKVSTYTRKSYIRTSSSTQNIYIGFYVPDATTTTIYCNGVLYIDLTAAFGAGNEPTQSWCDEKIPFFNGTYILYDIKKIIGTERSSIRRINKLSISLEELYYNYLFSDANLLAYYRFEGNANDTKNNKNGTASNVSYGTSYGKFGQGGLFNGSSSKIDIASFFSGSVPNMTINLWIKTTTTTESNIIQQRSSNSVDGQFVLLINTNGTITFWDYNGGYGFGSGTTSSTAVNNGQWHMVTFTKSGGNSGIYYIDGVQTNTHSGSDKSYNSSITSSIGYNRRDNNAYFNGQLDDISIFTKTLSSTEISSLYNLQVKKFMGVSNV